MAMTTEGLRASQNAGISFPGSRDRIGTRRRCQGFKLVELVVVLAIASTLGISAVSASYGSSGESRQGPRATAQTALADIAVQQEQYFLNNKRYTGDLGAEGLGVETTMTPGGHYALRVELPADACPAGYCYILTAVPQTARADDECGTLTLTSDGAKLPAGCW
jgi:type IV pilus assembly protein PilE